MMASEGIFSCDGDDKLVGCFSAPFAFVGFCDTTINEALPTGALELFINAQQHVVAINQILHGGICVARSFGNRVFA